MSLVQISITALQIVILRLSSQNNTLAIIRDMKDISPAFLERREVCGGGNCVRRGMDQLLRIAGSGGSRKRTEILISTSLCIHCTSLLTTNRYFYATIHYSRNIES